MRETKYRLILNHEIVGWGWHIKHKNSDVVEIFHSEDNKSWFRINNTKSDLCIKSPCILLSIPYDSEEQYTGFKIKKKEIYEGDKIHSNYYGTLIVKWDRDGKWIAECKDKDLGLSDDLWRAVGTCKLIGNIHE